MTALLRSTAVHRIAIAFLVLFSVNSLCASISGVLSGMDWAQSTTQQKWQAGFSVIGQWTAVLLAFFRTTLARIFKGESPLALSDQPSALSSQPILPMSDDERFAKLPEDEPRRHGEHGAKL